MAVTLRQRMKQLQEMLDGLPVFWTNTAKVLGVSAADAVKSRIIEEGKDAQGKPLVHAKSGKEYSEAELPLSMFIEKGLITKAQSARMPMMVSYEDVKKATGRYRGKRDMMYTGRMWANTGLTESKGKKSGFNALVKAHNSENQDKLDRNAELSDVDLLALSKDEEEALAQEMDAELQVYMEDTLKG